MRPIPLSALVLASVAAAGLACQAVVSVQGECPEFCPQGEIRVQDTLISDVEPVGSFSGYLLPHEARQMQVVGPGGPVESRGLLRFVPFTAKYTGDTTVKDSIIQTDSLQVRLNIVRRTPGVSGLTIALHEIPITVDSSTTYSDIAPYFHDSTLVSVVQVPDSLVQDTVTSTFPAGALRHFSRDSLEVGMGVRITSADPAFVSLAATTDDSSRTTGIALLRRFVQVDLDTGTTRVTRSDAVGLRFKTFVADPSGLPSQTGLVVGGAAGSRAFVKLNLPSSIVDSTLVVRATLLWPPPQPIFGAPGDTLVLRVDALGSDFGPKSPVADTSHGRTVKLPVGGSDTVAIDVTSILRLWRGNAAAPRSVMLQVQPEAGSINLVELPLAGSGAQAAIRVTYALPFRLPGS